MTRRFERSESALIRQKAQEIVQEEQLGRVIEVYEHSEIDDVSNFEADVVVDGETQLSKVPILTHTVGTIVPPQVGDFVLVSYLEGASKRPVITGGAFTNNNRPPLGKAGMIRNEFESGPSPLGAGNVYQTKYTGYSEDVSTETEAEPEPEDVYLRWSKRPDETADPRDESRSLPFKLEFYDSPKNDEAHLSVEISNVGGESADATWGMKFDMKTGEVKIADPKGYGIESDGAGNFTWSHKTIDFKEETSGGSVEL